MAIKRRPTDDEEDDDRPARRRKARDDDEDDDEEEDDDRPRKRRRSRDDEDDEEEDDDDRPRKRRRKRDDDETEDEDAPPDKAETKKPPDKAAKPGDKKAVEDDPEYLAWIKKKAQKRKQFLAASEGLQKFGKRAKLFLMLLAAVIGVGVAGWLLIAILGELIQYVAYLVLALFVIVPPVIGMQAAQKCRQGPPKMGGESNLGFEPIVGVAIIVFYGLGAACFFLFEDEIKLYGTLGCFGLGGLAYVVSFINEIMYLKVCGKYLKDKIRVNWAGDAVRHFVIFDIVAVPAVGAACFFLHYMGQLGLALAGVLVLAWLILVVKGFLDINRIVEGLRLTISKQLTADDKPNW